ncbi:MAG: glycine--tRNA ligase [Candidatus Liptonbacteria bacterium]|nr:glycine--tRNA ligase [Candidatus Liptonbacteria bacterium]
MEKIVSLAKRRGFIFPGSEIYGGLANSWDYGPLGVELKNNVKKLWWERFVHRRDDILGIDSSIIMNPKVWEASGHLKEFKDKLAECKNCKKRFKASDTRNDTCPACGHKSGFNMEVKDFNLMFQTHLGPVLDKKALVYLRPETAQAMFVDFKAILDSASVKIPFGIAQVGKAFRNEITPGNFIFRTREFEQMEIEYFIREKEWQKYFDYWQEEILKWIESVGINKKRVHLVEVKERERAHYSKRSVDFEYEFPFGQAELYGLAYRGDFDLKNHEKYSGTSLKYRDPDTGEEFLPHVIEPTWGVDRSVLAILLDSYEEESKGKEKRTVLRLLPQLAPYKAAVFPLLANKDKLIKLARKVYEDLRGNFFVAWDDRGNIGKRYFAQDEIGTPFCLTVDFESLENDEVTVRDRDSMGQERIKIEKLESFLHDKVYSKGR